MTRTSSPTPDVADASSSAQGADGHRPVRERMSDRVHDELFTAIRDLRLPPGAPLSETDLASQLGVSRTPVRDAIARLVEQRLVRVVPQVGTRVCLIEPHDVEEAVFIRSSLEGSAFSRACETNADVSGLRGILMQQEDAVSARDAEAFFVADEAFHQELFRLSGFPDAWNVVRSSKVQIDRIRRLVLPLAVQRRDLIEEHTAITDHLEAGSVVSGVALVTRHAGHVLEQEPWLRSQYPEYFAA